MYGHEDDYPTKPEELPDGSPQQLDAIARRHRLTQEDDEPPTLPFPPAA